MRTLPAGLALLAVLVFGAACGDGTEPDENWIYGTYPLRFVDLTRLPYTIQNTSRRQVEVTGGEIVLLRNGAFRDEIRYRVTPTNGVAGPDIDILSGTFMRASDILLLTPTGEPEGYTVTILDNGNLFQTVGAHTMVYVR